MTRSECLHKAESCVCGQREQDYGTPEQNFQLIADLWTAYLHKNISAQDVAMMMALLKIARIKNGGGTGDSFVDLAGYAACGAEINDPLASIDAQLKKDDDQSFRLKCTRCKYFDNVRLICKRNGNQETACRTGVIDHFEEE